MENEQNMPEKHPEKGKIDENTTIVVNSPETNEKQIRVNATIQKLIDGRSIKKQEEKEDLIDQNLLNELDLKKLLSNDDYLYYQEKKDQYLRYSPELKENPFDLDNLHKYIMEQIFQRNLLKRKKIHPAANIEDSMAASLKRENDLQKSLSMRRTDRLKNSEVKKAPINIAALSVIVTNPDNIREKQIVMDADAEEERFLREKGDKVVE